jgi:hypothetical protein
MELPTTLQALLNALDEMSPAFPKYPESDGELMADNSRQTCAGCFAKVAELERLEEEAVPPATT